MGYDAKDATLVNGISSSSRHRIAAASAQRAQLLAVIAETSNAKAALYQTRADLRNLWDKQGQADTALRAAMEAAERHSKDVSNLRSSRLRKLFHKDTYDADLKREEEQSSEADEWAIRAEAAVKALRKLIEDMTDKKTLLIEQVDQHKDAELQLLDLYSAVFDGPSPGHPDEDRLEAECEATQHVSWCSLILPAASFFTPRYPCRFSPHLH